MNLALVGFGLTVSLLAAELLVGVVAPRQLYRFPVGMFVNDDTRGYRLAPGFRGVIDAEEYTTEISVNAQGLRGSRDYGRKPEGTLRVLTVGDSFTNAYSVPNADSYPEQLAGFLGGATARTVEAVNGGFPGYDPWQTAAFLRSEGASFTPDVVVMGFFVGNDLQGVPPETSPVAVVDGYLGEKIASEGFIPVAMRSFLARKSQLYSLLWPLQRKLRHQDPDWKQTFAMNKYAIEPADETEQRWEATIAVLRDMQQTAEQMGTRFVVAAFPERVQVYQKEWNTRLRRMRLEAVAYDRFLPNRRLAADLAGAGIDYVDVMPALVAAAETSADLYFALDGHWTTEGNRTAGETVAAFLAQRLRSTLAAGGPQAP